MNDVSQLLELAKLIGRHVGAGTTFEREFAYWRDGGEYIGIKKSNLETFGNRVLVPEFAKWFHHPIEEARTFAFAALALAQRPLDRTLRWKWRDFWGSGGEPTIPVPAHLVRKFRNAQLALEEKTDVEVENATKLQ
jgi:hypothetical protein